MTNVLLHNYFVREPQFYIDVNSLSLNDDSNLNPKQKKESFYLINTKKWTFFFLKSTELA